MNQQKQKQLQSNQTFNVNLPLSIKGFISNALLRLMLIIGGSFGLSFAIGGISLAFMGPSAMSFLLILSFIGIGLSFFSNFKIQNIIETGNPIATRNFMLLLIVSHGMLLSGICAFAPIALLAFFITVPVFAFIFLYSYKSNQDMSKLGPYLFSGSIMMLILLVINIFLGSSLMYLLLSLGIIALAVGTLIYSVSILKQSYYSYQDLLDRGYSPSIAFNMSSIASIQILLSGFTNLFLGIFRLLAMFMNRD